MDDADSTTSKICRGTCCVLEYLINRNASAPRVKSHFHSNSAPPIPIVAYVQRIVRHAYCTDEAFIGALMFLAYHCAVTNHPITTYNVHRIYFTAVVIAIKCRDDHYRSNIYYAQVGGLTRQKGEVGTLETEFLSTIGWDTWMDEQIYMQTYTMVEQLSDLPADLSEDDLDEIAQAVDYWESKLFSSFQERREALRVRLSEDMLAVAAAQKRNSLTSSPTTPNSPSQRNGSMTSLAAVAGAPSFYPAAQRMGTGSAASSMPSGAPHSVMQGGSLLRRPHQSRITAEEQQQLGTIGQMSCDSALYNKFSVGEIIRVEKDAPVGYGVRAGSVGGTGAAEEDDDGAESQQVRRGTNTPTEAISCGMYIPRRSNNTSTMGAATTSSNPQNSGESSTTGSPLKVTNGGGSARGGSNTTRAFSSSNASPMGDRGLSTELYIPRKAKKRPVQAEGPNTPHDGSNNSRDRSFNSTPTSATTGTFPSFGAASGTAANTNNKNVREGSEMGGTSSFQGSPTEASNRNFPSVSRSTVAVTEVESKRSSLQANKYGGSRGVGAADEELGTSTPLTYNDSSSAPAQNPQHGHSSMRRSNAPSSLPRSFSPDVMPQGVPASANSQPSGFSNVAALSPNKPPLSGSSPSSGSFAGGFNTAAPRHARNRMATKHRFSTSSLCATPDNQNGGTATPDSNVEGGRYIVSGATNQRFASYHEYPAAEHHVDPATPQRANNTAPGVRLSSVPSSSCNEYEDGSNVVLAPRTEATKRMPERFLQVATGIARHNSNSALHQSGSAGGYEEERPVRAGSVEERRDGDEGEADRFASLSPQSRLVAHNSNSLGGGGGVTGGRQSRRIGHNNVEGKKRAKNPAWVQDD